MRILARFLLTLFLAAVGLVAGIALLTRPARAIATAGHSRKLAAALQLNELSERSVVYDRNGNLLSVLHVEENRSPVTLEEIPAHVVNAVLDVEDDHFYDHGGVNLRSILRAAVSNAQAGGVKQGGSTITQQLVKNSLLTPQKSLSRKAREAVLAVRLEQQMSKHDILERYLNTIYLGNEAYGVEAAAETYWGVHAKDLTVEQGALLAGLIRNPVGYDPLKPGSRATLALARRDLALDRMVARGHLEGAQANALKKVPLPTAKSDLLNVKDSDYYFVEEVKQALLDDPQKRLGDTYQERYNALFRGGLRIETTYDPRLQRLAEDKVEQKIPDTKGRFSAALVSLEPSTGAVRAMVSGRDPSDSQNAKYNLATGRGGSGRQPGSSFKPIVLLALLEHGTGPQDIINGSDPCPVRIDGVLPNPYEPGNYDGSKGGTLPIAEATARSLNCAFVRLGLSLDNSPFKSMDKVAEMARRLGISIPDDGKYGPSISLGAKEATPLEMASAYSTIANDGVRHPPYFVERVLDRNGKEIFKGQQDGKRIVEANVARAATSVLRGVVEHGTGTRARQSDRVVAGKTGTSQEWRDAWFIGFTPQLATAIWMGNPTKQDSMFVGGIHVTGGSYPAATWGAYMAEALKGQPALKFPEPDLSKFEEGKTVQLSKEAGAGGTAATTARPRPRPRTTATTSGTDTSTGGSGTSGTGDGTPTTSATKTTTPTVTSPPATSPPATTG